MSPGHKKQMAQAVMAHGLCSGRRACFILRLARATLWYRAGQRSDRQQQMVARLHALSEAHPRYGYRRMAALLRQEGWTVGKRQIQRLRRVEGLRVPPTKRKIARRGHSTGLPTKATHRGMSGPGTSSPQRRVAAASTTMPESDCRHCRNQIVVDHCRAASCGPDSGRPPASLRRASVNHNR